MGGATELKGPDLTAGVPLADIPDGGTLLGHARGEAVLLIRYGKDVFAIGATCTHYGAPLDDGMLMGREIRCPWHHACFDVRTGEPVAAPALTPVPVYRIEKRGGAVSVLGRTTIPAKVPRARQPSSITIIGTGAAGFAAAELLRREGYRGRLVMIGAEAGVPVDRPNLSKDYLAGTAPDEWIPLRPPDYYADNDIELMSGVRAVQIDAAARRVVLDDGRAFGWELLLLATGAQPVRLTIPGAEAAHVHTLRSLADSQAIIARAATAKAAVVVGAGFIGLEVAASLRARGLEVHVVAPESLPLERVLGAEIGTALRALHEEHGVKFHLGRKPASIEPESVVLDDGSKIEAQMVVVGVGVRASVALAEQAGCQVDRDGVLVGPSMETSVRGIYAAGDLARWFDRRSGENIRVEHWVVAQRQGQTVARNMLGRREKFDMVPFFWSQHYDVAIAYVGHVEGRWDTVSVHGSIAGRSCAVAYRVGGRIHAVATIGRDTESLHIEAAMEQNDQAAIERLLASIGG
jgi:NADPH-dependent 2,4-dienoyl-CoA reductase/sulfur reductase-like enzyme/nitrite reductase/ring-hydroxylating ferredoxin subunit